ncbi:MAG: valine--tRNA ligase [Bacteroidetes bacterium]|nr:MAG: valine--tRNA ligase [Bacteroidota bacterium]
MEIAKTYQPNGVEKKWYDFWLEQGFFKADEHSPKPKFSIVIPPPNVTGVLHMGHMLNNTIQDVLIRHARMNGFEACWVPGTDHASIATEAKVVNMLREMGLNKQEVGRERFLEYAFEWKEKYGGIILEQLKKLGASCDWDRTRFTMEESMSEAVTETFIHLYREGLIYRGERMVNWDPVGLTALSDEEVLPKETTLKLYYVQYLIEGMGGEYVTIATSRPETIMADSAICVHPEDERYKHLHGKKAIIPLINRSIPIITDEYVTMDFGTGCLKVTPAHDKNDFDLGQKHKLEIIDILNEKGELNEKAIIHVGEDRFKARKSIAVELEEQGFLLKTEDYASQVSISERTSAVVEPRISLQWFVDMKKFMERNPEVLSKVMDDEITLLPAKFKNTYRHWIENIKDWCISRQLWWGQRIPAWYDNSGNFVVAHSAEEAVNLFAEQGNNYGIDDLRQDEDVVDTWFSSWLWPITVFDGLKDLNNAAIKAFYPTSVLVTGPDIIFFWVARMVMAGYEFRNDKPFHKVYFTGIVRDKQGRKMSKSLGNSPDVLDLMDQYGTDGVRMGILLAAPAGNDLLFDESKIEQGRNFCNKIWNAFRLIKGWETSTEAMPSSDQLAHDWFEAKFMESLKTVEEKLADFKLSEALMEMYKLIWDDYCSWYLEMIKPAFGEKISAESYTRAQGFMADLMKMLHPFMPFITEEIYHGLFDGNPEQAVIVANYPKSNVKQEASSQFIQLISQVRALRNQKGLSPKETLQIALACSSAENKSHYTSFESLIQKLANVEAISFVTEQPAGTTPLMVGTDGLYVYLQEQINVEEEKEKAEKEIEYLKGFLKSVEAKLSNEKFVANAKPELVERERQKKDDALTKLRTLEESLKSLSS